MVQSPAGQVDTQGEMFDLDPEMPAALLAHRAPGARWLEWGCPLPSCDLWVRRPWELLQHAAAEHPGWLATWEPDRTRIVYRSADGHGAAG